LPCGRRALSPETAARGLLYLVGMHSSLPRLLGAAALGSLLVLSGPARADVAPPDDQKTVTYSFVVHGINTPDRVVFAYPCGTSSGAPVDELRLVENDKPLSVGRRGGSCTLYAIAKAEYETFQKTYTPSGAATDPALSSFAAKALKCSGGPSPVFVLPKTDSRTAVVEDLDVTKLDATTCTVVARPASSSSSSSSSSGAAVNPPASSSSSGCNASGATNAAAPWLVALAVPFFVLGSRRRKRGRPAA
jgi:uncharacterized protein (TIGR03382 family)